MKIRPANDLVVLCPDDLHKFWPKIQRGLKILHRRFGQDWIPEDIYHAVKAGNCMCLVSREGFDGFMVVSRIRAFRGEILWLWVAWAEPGCDVPGYWRELIAFADNLGIKRIQGSSMRPGWIRAAKRYGLKIRQVLFEHEIED